MDLRFSTAFHPQSDNQSEVTNRVMENFLAALCDADTSYVGAVVSPWRICFQQCYICYHWVRCILFKRGYPLKFAYVFDNGWIPEDNE